MTKKTVTIRTEPPMRAALDPEAWVKQPTQDSAEKTQRLVVELPQSLHRALKGRCGREGQKIKDVIKDLLEQYIEGKIKCTFQ